MEPAKKVSFFSGLTKNTFLLALTSLFSDISSEMLYPILPIFLTQTLKVSGSIVGLIEGVAGTTQNIVQGFRAVYQINGRSEKELLYLDIYFQPSQNPLWDWLWHGRWFLVHGSWTGLEQVPALRPATH